MVKIATVKLEFQMPKTGLMIPRGRIESCILLIRGRKVMLDSDLAGYTV